MPDDPSGLPGTALGWAGAGLGCIAIILLGFFELALGFAVGVVSYDALASASHSARLAVAIPVGLGTVWLADRLAKRLIGHSPLAALGELPPVP